MIETSCRDCIFAVFNEGHQNGCELGKLEKFHRRDETYIKDIDNDWFYTIKRFCNTCRNQEWLDKPGNSKEKAIEEAKFQYSAIVIENSKVNQEEIKENLVRSLDSLKNQQPLPQSIVMVLCNPNLDVNNTRYFINDWFRNNALIIPFSFVIPQEVENRDNFDLLDYGVEKIDSAFYVGLESGYLLLDDFIDALDYKLNTKLDQFCVIKGLKRNSFEYDIHELVVQTLVHKAMGGSKYGNVIDRIIEKAKEDKKEHLII